MILKNTQFASKKSPMIGQKQFQMFHISSKAFARIPSHCKEVPKCMVSPFTEDDANTVEEAQLILEAGH